MACEYRSFLGPILAHFLPAVANRLLFKSALSTVIAWRDPTYGVKSARCTEQEAHFGLDGRRNSTPSIADAPAPCTYTLSIQIHMGALTAFPIRKSLVAWSRASRICIDGR